MDHGYSESLIQANRQADGKQWGVKLGRRCIKVRVPIATVAKRLSVSRQTVYNWFTGRNNPGKYNQKQVEKYFDTLSQS